MIRFIGYAAVALWLCLATAPASGQQVSRATEEGKTPPVKVVRMYADASGETHLETIELPRDSKSGRMDGLPVTDKIWFARFPADLNRTGATSDSLKYLVVLSGAGFEIEVTDGSKQQFRPGSVLMTDDMKSKGHNIRALGGDSLVMYMTIDASAKVSSR